MVRGATRSRLWWVKRVDLARKPLRLRSSFRLAKPGLSAAGELGRVLQPCTRCLRLTKKVGESLAPRLSKLPGFSGYFLIDTGEGVMSSIGLFDTPTQANESTRVASEWVRDEKLERILKTPPKVTDGEVIVHKTNGAVRA